MSRNKQRQRNTYHNRARAAKHTITANRFAIAIKRFAINNTKMCASANMHKSTAQCAGLAVTVCQVKAKAKDNDDNNDDVLSFCHTAQHNPFA